MFHIQTQIVPDVEVDLLRFKTHFCFDGTDIAISTEFMNEYRIKINAQRLDSDQGWSDNLEVLIIYPDGNIETVAIGPSDSSLKNVEWVTRTAVESKVVLPSHRTPYRLVPCPSPRWVSRTEFNNEFHGEVVVLPSYLYAVGIDEKGALSIYNESWGAQYFMIEACIRHLVSVALTYEQGKKFYFVICGHDGFSEELWPNVTRDRPRFYSENECQGQVRVPELEENEYPILHKNSWILGQSTLVGFPNALPIVDRHYFYHNLYHPFRSWSRGILFKDKIAKIAFGGQERGSRYNFLHRRDLQVTPRQYFWSDAVSKRHVEPPTRSWLDRNEQVLYKYVLDIDGNASTWDATAWKLNSGSVIFKVESGWKQWFYDMYIPWVHYVPIADDFHDLDEKFEWCEQHPEECIKMIEQCKQLFQRVYGFNHVIAYTRSVLQKLLIHSDGGART